MYDEDLNNLEDWIRRLKVEYDIFFNGSRKRPPEDLKMRVDKLAKKLAESSNMTIQQRFRYNTLVARYYVLKDLWRRVQQERELGLPSKGELRSSKRAKPEPPQPGSAAADQVRVSIADPDREDEKVRQLYEALLSMSSRRAQDSPRVSYEQFARYITAQIKGIRGKFRCSSVVFTVALEENAIKFTATAGSGA